MVSLSSAALFRGLISMLLQRQAKRLLVHAYCLAAQLPRFLEPRQEMWACFPLLVLH